MSQIGGEIENEDDDPMMSCCHRKSRCLASRARISCGHVGCGLCLMWTAFPRVHKERLPMTVLTELAGRSLCFSNHSQQMSVSEQEALVQVPHREQKDAWLRHRAAQAAARQKFKLEDYHRASVQARRGIGGGGRARRLADRQKVKLSRLSPSDGAAGCGVQRGRRWRAGA